MTELIQGQPKETRVVEVVSFIQINKKGMGGESIIGSVVGLVTVFAVAIPVTSNLQQVMNDTGQLTPIAQTVLTYTPTLIALSGLALVAGMVGFDNVDENYDEETTEEEQEEPQEYESKIFNSKQKKTGLIK